ncbi:Eukaryotic rRNA processing like protein [Aduncisulcus paluster]|uniref:Eukaryotic rRNA processing like protein n=1 Tax=Aduncisulcus paluster TaxID=2918883 RepID=A0ABQ5K6T1_9EUKA|nr:Eukaryotic rRNA processing like protein [Aduncisulcus paluster]
MKQPDKKIRWKNNHPVFGSIQSNTIMERVLATLIGSKSNFLNYQAIDAKESKSFDPEDDTKREQIFLEEALCSVSAAKKLCDSINLPFKPPEFEEEPEMVKKDFAPRDLDEERIESGRKERMRREILKFGKKLQGIKEKHKQQRKKASEQAIEQWKELRRSQKGKRVDLSELVYRAEKEIEKETASHLPKNTLVGRKMRSRFSKGVSGDERRGKKGLTHEEAKRKRMQKNKRYGYGGKKRGIKRNSASSVNSFEMPLKHFSQK